MPGKYLCDTCCFLKWRVHEIISYVPPSSWLSTFLHSLHQHIRRLYNIVISDSSLQRDSMNAECKANNKGHTCVMIKGGNDLPSAQMVMRKVMEKRVSEPGADASFAPLATTTCPTYVHRVNENSFRSIIVSTSFAYLVIFALRHHTCFICIIPSRIFTKLRMLLK